MAINTLYQSNTLPYARSAKNELRTLDVMVVQTWMEKCYCEGEEKTKLPRATFGPTFRLSIRQMTTKCQLFSHSCLWETSVFTSQSPKKDGKSSMYQKLGQRSFENQVHWRQLSQAVRWLVLKFKLCLATGFNSS